LIDISSNCTEKRWSCQLVDISKFEKEEEREQEELYVCLFVCFLSMNDQNKQSHKYLKKCISKHKQ
jgi:hypothetical protein